MSFFLICKLIAHTPFPDENWCIFLCFFQQMMLICNKCPICPEFVDVRHILHCLNINMSIQHYVFHMLLYKEVFPYTKAEAIVKYDYFLLRQNPAQSLVSIHIKLFQKSCRNMMGTLRLVFVRSHFPAWRSHINTETDWLIQNLDSKQAFSVLISFCQSFQYSQYKFHLIRHLAPFTNSHQAAIVITVLTARCRMQIYKNLQAILFCPVKSFVQIFDTATIWFSVSENKIRNRNADCVKSVRSNIMEILFCHISIPVLLHHRPEFLLWHITVQPGFILRTCSLEDKWLHPFLQYQPVAKIGSYDFVHINTLPVSFLLNYYLNF